MSLATNPKVELKMFMLSGPPEEALPQATTENGETAQSTHLQKLLLEAETQLQRLRRENSAFRRKMEETIRLRDELLSVASHELKTPLTSLGLQLEFMSRSLEKEAPPSTERLKRSIAKATQQVQRINCLVDGVLDPALLGDETIQLKLESFDLSDLVHEICEKMSPQLSIAGCELITHLDQRCMGRWDRLRIEQVITNLLSNAARFGARKPVTVRVRKREQFALLSVEDLGIGIPPEDQGRIFERHARASCASHFGGLGLGLFVVRRITLAHQGTVEVESAVGAGARFHVRLPIEQSPEKTESTND